MHGASQDGGLGRARPAPCRGRRVPCRQSRQSWAAVHAGEQGCNGRRRATRADRGAVGAARRGSAHPARPRPRAAPPTARAHRPGSRARRPLGRRPSAGTSTFRSSSSCCRRSSTKVLPLSCDVEARTRYGPVAVTSLPRPALYGSAIARFAFGDLYRGVQVENELRALERHARPVAAAAGRTHLAADMLHEDFITEGVQSAWPCATTRVLPAQSALFRRFHRCAERHGFLIEIAC